MGARLFSKLRNFEVHPRTMTKKYSSLCRATVSLNKEVEKVQCLKEPLIEVGMTLAECTCHSKPAPCSLTVVGPGPKHEAPWEQ